MCVGGCGGVGVYVCGGRRKFNTPPVQLAS